MSFLDTAFETVVVFSAVDHMTGSVRRMAGSLGVLDEQTRAVQQRMNEFRNMTFVGGAITMAGAKLVSVMEGGLDQAGQFLTKMTMIQDVTGATASQMERIQKTIQSSSGKTIFGVQDTASFAQQLATSGLTADQTSGLLPLFTQFGEVQKLGKGMDPTTAIQEAVQGAHAVGAYAPDQLAEFLNKYNQASFMTPGSTTELADTFKYLAPKGAGIGMTTDDMLTTAALANRMGLAGSMGGTHAADMILRAIPGLFKGKAQPAALKELGINAYDSSGKFKGITEFITELQGAAEKIPNGANRSRLFHAAFGNQGLDLANLLSSPRGMEQLTALASQMNAVKPISDMQHDINQTPEGQRLQLATNIENLKLDVWLELAKLLNPMFKDLNNIVSSMQDFANTHPEVAKMAAEFLTFAAAAALTVGPLLLITGAIGYLSTANMFATGFRLLGIAIKGISSPVLGLVAAGYLLYQAWTNDWGGIREKTKVVTDWLDQEIPKAIKNVKDFAKDLGLINDKGNIEMPPWLKNLLIGLASAKVAMDLLKLSTLTFNLLAAANPWILALAGISLAVMLLVTHWDDVKKAVEDARVAVQNFLGKGPAVEKSTEQAHDNFYNNPNYVPNNPNGTLQPSKGGLTTWWNNFTNNGKPISGGLKLPGNAAGTDNWRGGLTWINENGPELVNLPNGTQIVPNHKLGSLIPPRDSGSTIIAKGAIVVNAAPGQSEEGVADSVMRRFGTKTRMYNLSRSRGVNRLVY